MEREKFLISCRKFNDQMKNKKYLQKQTEKVKKEHADRHDQVVELENESKNLQQRLANIHQEKEFLQKNLLAMQEAEKEEQEIKNEIDATRSAIQQEEKLLPNADFQKNLLENLNTVREERIFLADCVLSMKAQLQTNLRKGLYKN